MPRNNDLIDYDTYFFTPIYDGAGEEDSSESYVMVNCGMHTDGTTPVSSSSVHPFQKGST